MKISFRYKNNRKTFANMTRLKNMASMNPSGGKKILTVKVELSKNIKFSNREAKVVVKQM